MWKGRVLIPGFVPDEVLVALFQSTELAVYPSLYEGYGLPVIDSLACGAPTIAGDNSSLREILPREARFEPSDPGAIAAAIVRALTDKPFRERLMALTNVAAAVLGLGCGQGGCRFRGAAAAISPVPPRVAQAAPTCPRRGTGQARHRPRAPRVAGPVLSCYRGPRRGTASGALGVARATRASRSRTPP